jgi:hypothetical protein
VLHGDHLAQLPTNWMPLPDPPASGSRVAPPGETKNDGIMPFTKPCFGGGA